MIIKTDALKTDDGAWNTINHVFNKPEDNEEITVIQGSQQRVRDDYETAIKARSRHGVIHVKLSPEGEMNDDGWQRCTNGIAKEFDCDPAALTIVQHTKKGRTHRHIYIPSYDPIAGKKRSLSWSKYRSVALAKILETELGHPHTPIPDYLNKRVCKILSERGYDDLVKELDAVPEGGRGHQPKDEAQAKRHGLDIKEVKASLKSALENNHDRKSLETALKNLGWRIELLDSESGKRKRWAFIFIADPKWSLPTTRGTGFSKTQIDKLMEKNNVDIQQKTPEAAAKEAAIKDILIRGSEDRRTGIAAEAEDKHSVTGQTVRRDKETSRPTASRPSNVTDNGHRGAVAGTRNQQRGQPDRRIAGDSKSDIRDTAATSGTAKLNTRPARHPVKRQETPVERYKASLEGKHPVNKLKAVRSLQNSSQGFSFTEAPACYADGYEDVDPNSHYSDQQQLEYYRGRLTHRFSKLSNVKFNGESYLVTTKKGQQFKDYGDRITTPRPGNVQQQTATEIVRAAKSRGWKSINVKGSEQYRDQITIAAALNGIETNHELSERGKEQLAKQIEWRREHGYNLNNVIYLNEYRPSNASFEM